MVMQLATVKTCLASQILTHSKTQFFHLFTHSFTAPVPAQKPLLHATPLQGQAKVG